MWQQWVNGILGLWLIVSAFINFAPQTAAWNIGISGAIIAILAFWGASQNPMSANR